MEKVELKEAIKQGLPFAVKYEDLKNKRDGIVFPILIGSIIICILMITFLLAILPSLNHFISDVGYKEAFFEIAKLSIGISIITAIIPVLNLVPLGIGSLALISSNKKLSLKMTQVQLEFVQKTNLHSTFINTATLNKFSEYLQIGMANSLEECARIYYNVTNQIETLHEFNKIKTKNPLDNDELNPLSDPVSKLRFK